MNAAENSDFSMAQAILDGANIYIPHGTMIEAYDELGNQYKVPVYCLSTPLNLLREDYDVDFVIEGNLIFFDCVSFLSISLTIYTCNLNRARFR